MRHGCEAVIVGRKFVALLWSSGVTALTSIFCRLDRLSQAAKELSATTGRRCIPAQADVRDPKALREAVAVALKEFGKIDFVICGMSVFHCWNLSSV